MYIYIYIAMGYRLNINHRMGMYHKAIFSRGHYKFHGFHDFSLIKKFISSKIMTFIIE